MNPKSIVVQQASGRPEQLILLFHGVGANPEGLVPLARRLASTFPHSTVVSVAAPQQSRNPGGYQWFSVDGVTEENRVDRVAEAMPAFLGEIREWQKIADVTPTFTALVGFSQGGIMALESSLTETPPAARVISIGGRFARLPEHAPPHTTIHLVHGKEDPVIPYAHCIAGAERLLDLDGDVTADVIPFAQHEVSDEMADVVIERLRGHIPKRLWDEALRDESRFPRSR
jgi:phospholipase/carboxylesterase